MNIAQIKANNPSPLSTHYSERLNAYISIEDEKTYIWYDGWVDAKSQPINELTSLNEQVLDIELVTVSDTDAVYNVTDKSNDMMFNVTLWLCDINDHDAVKRDVLAAYDNGNYEKGHVKLEANRDRAIAAIKADQYGDDEQVCIRMYGLDTDLWIDTNNIASNCASFYVYLESLLRDEDYELLIDSRDFEIVDYEGVLTSACYSGHGFVDFEKFDQANDMDLDNEVIAAGLRLGIDIDRIEDAYEGKWDDDEEWAWDYIENTGMLSDVPDSLRNYFDIEKWARDAMFDMMKEGTHYFRNY